MEVPFHAADPLFIVDDSIPTPGAYQSTQVPEFENEALLSALSDAPMVIASVTLAGE